MAPKNTVENGGRDESSGRFLPGNHGSPGRPRGIDFRKLVQDFRGAALDGDLQAVFDAMKTRALAGDVAAAKLLLDRLCDTDPIRVAVEDNDAESIARQVNELMAVAAKRKKSK